MNYDLNELVNTLTDIVLSKEITAEDLDNMSCDDVKKLIGKYSMKRIKRLRKLLKEC